MYDADTVPCLRCMDCTAFNVRADLPGEVSHCKRIDHKLIKFAIPWFKSYDCNGPICADFAPRHPDYADFRDWTGYENWATVAHAVRRYGDRVWFTINGDTHIRYGVPADLFVHGGMIEGDTLKADRKMYYKQSRKSPIGYELITEEIDGVHVEGLSEAIDAQGGGD